MKYLWAAIITLWLVVAVYFYINYVLFHKHFGKAGKKKNPPAQCKENVGSYERINITSADQFILTAKLFTPANGDGKRSVLLCHDYRSNGEADFAKELDFYKNLGYNILLIEQRCHGKSAGDTTSMGITESYDVVYWCSWLELRFGTGCPTVVHGKGMGAFAALVALASPELPQNVIKAVVSEVYDSVFEKFSQTVKNKYDFWSKVIIPTVNMFYRLNTGFDMRDADIKNFAKKISTPVLFDCKDKETQAFKTVRMAVSGEGLEKFLNE
ncbi:MAG: alpha/beta hydrolase [Clostridia bacterium]|nr:alpha/beta hydrolase [Clostridia bacterium]